MMPRKVNGIIGFPMIHGTERGLPKPGRERDRLFTRTVGLKGQLSIPEEVRQHAAIQPGVRVVFKVIGEGGFLVVRDDA